MKFKLLIFLFLFLISCKQNNIKILTYKEAELTESMKETLDLYIHENKLNNEIVEIILNGINDENEVIIQCAEKDLVIGNIARIGGNYICYHKQFRITLMYNKIDSRIFKYENKIVNKEVDIDAYNFKPSGFGEFPPTWYLNLDHNKISKFYYQNSNPSKEVIERIESLIFNE